MRIKNIFLSLSLFILLSASALAQSGETVSLQIIDATGKVIATQTAAKDGSFNFSNLPSGDYRVKVRFPNLAKQTQGATFGERVNAGLAKSDKGTNGQNSTGITADANDAAKARVNKVDSFSIKQKTAPATTEEAANERRQHKPVPVFQAPEPASNRHFTIKLQSVAGANFIKIESVAPSNTRGLKDMLKTQVRTASPSAVTVESWSWGASNNSIAYETENENSLQEGVDCFIKVNEQKNFSGKVEIGSKVATYDVKANKK